MNSGVIMLFIFWSFLNIMISITLNYALYAQLELGINSFWEKLLHSEFWASIEWIFLIPAQVIGYSFFTPIQLSLTSFGFEYLTQLLFVIYNGLQKNITLDEYVGLFIILFALYASKTNMFH